MDANQMDKPVWMRKIVQVKPWACFTRLALSNSTYLSHHVWTLEVGYLNFWQQFLDLTRMAPPLENRRGFRQDPSRTASTDFLRGLPRSRCILNVVRAQSLQGKANPCPVKHLKERIPSETCVWILTDRRNSTMERKLKSRLTSKR